MKFQKFSLPSHKNIFLWEGKKMLFTKKNIVFFVWRGSTKNLFGGRKIKIIFHAVQKIGEDPSRSPSFFGGLSIFCEKLILLSIFCEKLIPLQK
jgi:hypothetical protein